MIARARSGSMVASTPAPIAARTAHRHRVLAGDQLLVTGPVLPELVAVTRIGKKPQQRPVGGDLGQGILHNNVTVPDGTTLTINERYPGR